MGGRGVFSASQKAWVSGGNIATTTDITSKYAGMTLKQAEDTLRNIDDHEEAVIFDKHMNVILALSGDNGSVGLPVALQKRDDITITHNHPANDTNYGATLSPADVSWFASSRAKEMRAVASGQGEFVYSLQVRGKQATTKTKYEKTQLNLWAHAVIKDATPKKDGGTGKLQSDYQREYNAFIKQGKSVKVAKHAAWQKATGTLSEV